MVQDYAMQGEENAATSQPRMLDTKVINEEPTMNTDIQQDRDECETCRKIAPSQAATLPKPLPLLDYPFQMMLSDYF